MLDLSMENVVREFGDGTAYTDNDIYDNLSIPEKVGYYYAHGVLDILRRMER